MVTTVVREIDRFDAQSPLATNHRAMHLASPSKGYIPKEITTRWAIHDQGSNAKA